MTTIKEILERSKETGAKRKIILMTQTKNKYGSLYFSLWSDGDAEFIFIKKDS